MSNKKITYNIKFTPVRFEKIFFACSLFALSVTNIDQVCAQSKIQLDERENYVESANEFFRKGESKNGKKVIDQGLDKYPKDSDLRTLLGKYYFEEKKYDASRYELMKALEYNKQNVSAKQLLVNVEIASERYSSAICYINELLEINPYWKGLWRKKIDVYRLQGNHIEANRLLKRISHIYPEDNTIKDAYLYYIEQEIIAKKNEGKIDNAVSLGAELLEENPGNESFCIELINNCLKAGDYEKALVNAEKGLYNIPRSIKLIEKKADILGNMNRYDEALEFLRTKINEGIDKDHLERRYDHFLEEAARYHRNSDPYTLYGILYKRNPRNEEAFNYIVNTALAEGLYEDALDAIKTAVNSTGETKELLLKKRSVYERMGARSKIDELTVRLYLSYPNDSDIKDEYTLYKVRSAKAYMAEELYDKALEHWEFVSGHDDPDLKKTALASSYNCLLMSERFDEALAVSERLAGMYPDESEWYIKKAIVLGKQKKYVEALQEYGQAITFAPETETKKTKNGYGETAASFVKQLIEEHRLNEALHLTEYWLTVDPGSEAGIRYAINISAQTNDLEKFTHYASSGIKYHPGEMFFIIKSAEALDAKKKYKEAFELLSPETSKNPYHKELIRANSQAADTYVAELIKKALYEESSNVLSDALAYDPNNKMLKYRKGIVCEKTHDYDSAYYYQSFYEPAPTEAKEFQGHLKFLKNKTFKNQISCSYLRSRYGNEDVISSVSTLEYIRFETRNTFIGRINYAGRDNGKGLQGQLEWYRTWKTDIYTRIDAGASDKFFPEFTASGTVHKTFKNDWEGRIGGSFRKTDDKENLFGMTVGASKGLELWQLNARFNSLIMRSEYYYNILAQARYYLGNPQNYITAMGSIGSAPDVEIIDYELYNGFSVTNTMVGLGINRLFTETFSAGILGNWYNYGDKNDTYKNLYNIHIQLYVSF